jgi:dUTP pyrophosphatase
MPDTLKVMLLSKDAKLPQRMTKGSGGYDCYSPKNVVIQPGCRDVIKLDIAMKVPDGYVAILYDRSSYGKNGIDIVVGVVDCMICQSF